MVEGIKITKRPKLKNPYLIAAWPGMGEVAFKAATQLVEKLGAQEFASLNSEDFFYLTGTVVQEGVLTIPQLPQGKFYFWKNPGLKSPLSLKGAGPRDNLGDLLIFISNAQPDLAKAEVYSRRIIQLAKSFKVRTVFSFAAMPQPIEHTQEPNIWYVCTSKDLVNTLKRYNFNLLAEGQISGMNGLFLGLAKQEGLEGACLLADIPLYTIHIENPKASARVLEALAKIMGTRIDTAALMEQAQTMEAEIDKLLDYLHLGSPAAPIGEEEIERIKKSLSQLTKLPLSVKEKIEKLFQEAEADISRAHELKSELDKWNVYKEYEDRFLDLFRKNKEKGN